MTTWSPNQGPYVNADLKFDAVVKAVGQTYQVPVVDLATIWQGHDDVTGPAGTVIPDFTANGPGIRSTLINAAMIKLLLNSLKLWRNDTCKHR